MCNLAVRKHIFSLGNSLGPSEPSHTWLSVSRYTSRHTHRRWIWLVRSWRPGRGPCSSDRNTFTSLSIACTWQPSQLEEFQRSTADVQHAAAVTLVPAGYRQSGHCVLPSRAERARRGARHQGNGGSTPQRPTDVLIDHKRSSWVSDDAVRPVFNNMILNLLNTYFSNVHFRDVKINFFC